MKARQFFDVWTTTTTLVSLARTYPLATASYRGEAVGVASHRHGAEVGEKAGLLFDSLRDGARSALK